MISGLTDVEFVVLDFGKRDRSLPSLPPKYYFFMVRRQNTILTALFRCGFLCSPEQDTIVEITQLKNNLVVGVNYYVNDTNAQEIFQSCADVVMKDEVPLVKYNNCRDLCSKYLGLKK